MRSRATRRFKVGWQHRRCGTIIGRKFSIAETLMDILTKESTPPLHSLLPDEEVDDIADDLSLAYCPLRDDSVESPDYTVCSAEDCGYCGKCCY